MFCHQNYRKKSTVVAPELSSLVIEGHGRAFAKENSFRRGEYEAEGEEMCELTKMGPRMTVYDTPHDDCRNTERRSEIPDVQPVFRAVDIRSLDTLTTLLSNRPDLANCHGGEFHTTPLHHAVEVNWSQGVERLLEFGAAVTSRNQYGQTPLHYAAARKLHSLIPKLAEKCSKATIDLKDLRGLTALHDAASVGCTQSVKQLIKKGANPSITDSYGQTPLHKATKAGALECAATLMKAGADILLKDDRGVTPKRYIREHPENLETLLDLGIQTSSNRQSGFPLTFDFSILVDSYKIQQCRLLENFAKSDCNYLLAHPLCHILLLVKWRKARIVFIGYLLFFTIFSALTYVMMLDRFVYAIRNATIDNITSVEKNSKDARFLEVIDRRSNRLSPSDLIPIQVIMIIQMVIFLAGQLSRLRNFTKSCLKSVTWWLLLSIIILCSIIIIQSWISDGDMPAPWERHVATVIVMLEGTQILHLLSKFPSFGIYWLMFVRVALMFLRVFFIYVCLLVTFTMTFYLALATQNKTGTFDNSGFTFLKSLTMMIGELDLEEMKADLTILPWTSHILLVLFILLVSIILANLLVALAVSDINELRAIAHLMRLASMVEAIISIEQLWDCPFLKCLAQLCYLPTRDLQFRLWPRTDQRHTKIIVKLNESASKLRNGHPKNECTWFMYFAEKLRSNQYSVHISTCILENILDRLDVKEGNLDSRLSVKFRCLGRSVGGRKISAAEVVTRRRHTLCRSNNSTASSDVRRKRLLSKKKKCVK